MYKIAKFNSELRTGIDEVLKQFSIAITLAIGAWLGTGAPPAQAAPCLIVTLTGTTGGPPVINGLAGVGTLVRYGDDANNCGALNLQFDSGRDTAMRLSQLGVTPGCRATIKMRGQRQSR